MATPKYLNTTYPIIDVKTGTALPALARWFKDVIDAFSIAVLGLPATPNGVLITNAVGAPTIGTTLPALDGSALTDLNASELTTGTVPQARKWTETTTTAVGTQHNVAIAGADLLRVNNATLTTITGLVAGVAAQRLVLRSVGAGVVTLANQDVGSTAANRLITGVNGALSVSWAHLVYDGTTARWVVLAYTSPQIAVAALPATPPAGVVATVSDSNTIVWGATVAGGGANPVAVRFNGTNWTVVGI